MNVKLAALALVIAVLGGCGGGSDSPKAEPTPTPRVYTLEELSAALPTTDSVDGANGLGYSCPKDKDRCPAMEEGERVSVDINLLPVGDSPAEMEEAGSRTIFGNSVSVSAWKHESLPVAKKRMSVFRTEDKKWEGSYDVKQVGDIKTGVTPGEKGKGSFKVLRSGSWKGHFMARRGTWTIDDTTEQRLIASAEMAQDDVTLSVSVNVLADGRPADFATKLARTVLADYLKRLG